MSNSKMSSPSQIAEPSARPSVLRAPASSVTQPGRTYKAFGQDYQFAERMSNPFPEFIVHDPEPAPMGATTANAHGIPENVVGQVDGADDRTASTEVPLDRCSSSKESPVRESVWTPPPSQPWYKKVKNFWWLTLVITVLGILGVLMAILGAMGMLGNHSRPSALDSPSSTDNATATSTTSTLPSTTSTSPLPTSTSVNCSDNSSFIANIHWIGLEPNTYDSEYQQAGSAKACCDFCAGSAGCAGWIYNGSSIYTPCTKIVISVKKPDSDKQCPNGYAGKTTFARGEDCVGGIGPCSKGFIAN